MTTVQITLPDELAREAADAGLLSPAAIETMLRDRLRLRAGESLRAMWNRAPAEDLTPAIEAMIDDEVRAVRAERRGRTAI